MSSAYSTHIRADSVLDSAPQPDILNISLSVRGGEGAFGVRSHRGSSQLAQASFSSRRPVHRLLSVYIVQTGCPCPAAMDRSRPPFPFLCSDRLDMIWGSGNADVDVRPWELPGSSLGAISAVERV